MTHEVDVVVIGAGPAGENVAARAVRGGLTVAIIESGLAGGDCSYWACIPSKALLRPVALATSVSRVAGMQLEPLDRAAALARRDEAVSHFDDADQVSWIRSLPAEFIRGRGRLLGPKEVGVTRHDGGELHLRARHAVVLATGSAPATPAIPGLAEASPWTSRDATSVQTPPQRLAIIGGGPVACEMAQAMHGLGTREVTVIARSGLLTSMPEFAGEMIASSLRTAGIDVRTAARVTSVERPEAGGKVIVHLTNESPVEADELVVAAGRVPSTAGLDLGTVGLTDDTWVEVDDSMCATAADGRWLYAVGDANGRSLLTHVGKYQARVCGDVIAARAHGHDDGRPGLRDLHASSPPQVIFTDPQVCSVGRTEATARSQGLAVRTVEYDLAQLAGSYLLGDGYVGRAQIVVDEDRRVIVGATFVGAETSELLHAASIAIVSGATLDQLWHAVPSFPTLSEVWLRLLESYGL